MIETKGKNKTVEQWGMQQYRQSYSFLSRSYTARNVLQMLQNSNWHILVVISNGVSGSV